MLGDGYLFRLQEVTTLTDCSDSHATHLRIVNVSNLSRCWTTSTYYLRLTRDNRVDMMKIIFKKNTVDVTQLDPVHINCLNQLL